MIVLKLMREILLSVSFIVLKLIISWIDDQNKFYTTKKSIQMDSKISPKTSAHKKHTSDGDTNLKSNIKNVGNFKFINCF
mgnify:CR=1 FL=1